MESHFRDGAELFDGVDPDVIKGVILDIPLQFFNSFGQKESRAERMNGIQTQIKQGQPDLAIEGLLDVGGRFDGCLGQKEPDQNDWINDCNAQFEVRLVFDAVVTNVFSVTPYLQ